MASAEVDPIVEGTEDSEEGVSQEIEAEEEDDNAVSSDSEKSAEPFKDELDLEEVSSSLSEFFRTDTVAQIAELDSQIEEMLNNMQEICGHLATVQSDTGFVLQQKIPEIHSRAMHIKTMYEQVEQVEAFVAMVGRNVSQLEESVTTAEKMFGSNPISRALKGFSRPSFLSGFGSKPKVVASKPEARWEAPEIFCTTDYFPGSPEKSSAAAVSTEGDGDGES